VQSRIASSTVLVELRLFALFADAVVDGHPADCAIPDPVGIGVIRNFRAFRIGGPFEECQFTVALLVDVPVATAADLGLQQPCGFPHAGMATEISVSGYRYAVGIKIPRDVGFECASLGQDQMVVQDFPGVRWVMAGPSWAVER